jgi:hypothetical protein
MGVAEQASGFSINRHGGARAGSAVDLAGQGVFDVAAVLEFETLHLRYGSGYSNLGANRVVYLQTQAAGTAHSLKCVLDALHRQVQAYLKM